MDELDAVARSEIQPGWQVIDADGQAIGMVEDVGDHSFTLRANPPADTVLAIAFDDIESADDGRVELAIGGDELAAMGEEAEL